MSIEKLKYTTEEGHPFVEKGVWTLWWGEYHVYIIVKNEVKVNIIEVILYNSKPIFVLTKKKEKQT